MNVRKSLGSLIRGWLPKEPILPSQSRSIQKPPNQKPLPRNKLSWLWVVTIIVLGDLFVITNLFLGLSIIQVVLIIFVGVLAVSFLLFRRTSFRGASKFLKFATVIVFVLALCFNGLGVYLFATSGYPPTYVPQLSYPDVLKVSLTQNYRSLEQAQSFRFIQLQHSGAIFFGKLSLWAYTPPTRQGVNGYIQWTFYPSDIGIYILMGNNERKPYTTGTSSLFYKVPYASLPTIQSMEKTFEQIDALGLGWYQKQALDIYQNQTGSAPEIGGLRLQIAYDNLTNYQGITVQLSTFTKSLDNNGNIVYPNSFSAEFQPNGTLLSFNRPT